MKVLYSAPVRSTHYGYAAELFRAGMLHSFVTGVSRFAPHAALPEISGKLVRADLVQNLYLAALKSGMPRFLSDELAHVSKAFIDQISGSHIRGADLFMFYNGCGLDTARRFRKQGGINVVELVNSHVLVQEEILCEEYHRLQLPWMPFHGRETRRRAMEYDVADRIIVPSEFVRRGFLERGFSSEKLIKIPYRVNRVTGGNTRRGDLAHDDDTFRILYVGSVSPRKGLRYLIEAFATIRHPRKELWIVGPVASPSGLEGLSIPEGVIFKGILKGDALQDAYQQASLFCLPTIEDGFGIVLGEALAYGLPVVATRNSGAEDLLTHDKEGIITDIRDPKALCAAFERAISDKEWFTRIRENALIRADQFQKGTTETFSVAERLRTLEHLIQTR
jgi:alpha-maltose-1-phosphate synthase